MTITRVLKDALNDGISSGKFIDTQIILFSRRDASGRVCKPRALYANSHVLKSVPYFNNRELLLRSTSNTCSNPSPGVLSGPFSESETKDFSETIDDGEYAEDYGYSSDSDLEEDWDFESPAPPGKPQSPRPGVLYGEYQENVRMGKVIRIRDVAFITCVCPKFIRLLPQLAKRFQAFLLALYTRSVRFAPFGSEENRKSRSPEIAWTKEGEIPATSPKSFYRLVDKVTNHLAILGSHC
jgi:hypothetical protein